MCPITGRTDREDVRLLRLNVCANTWQSDMPQIACRWLSHQPPKTGQRPHSRTLLTERLQIENRYSRPPVFSVRASGASPLT